MDYLTVGHIVKTIGLKGELKIYPTTNFRDSRFKAKSHLFVFNDKTNERIEVIVKSHHKNGNFDQLFFVGYSTIESVECFVGQSLQVVKDNKLLKKDEYYYSDLIGLDVYFDNGQYIGKVKRVEEYASYQTLRIESEQKDVLIPFVNAFIIDVDLEKKIIKVKYMDGLKWK
mgnify:FL=1